MISPENIKKLLGTMREATIKQMEADKPRLQAIGLTDLTVEEFLLFQKMSEALTSAFFEFVKAGTKKEGADAAPPAG
jgi:hypothetical protein